MKKSERMCWWCDHFTCDSGTGDYSEVTPGDRPEMRCGMGHWAVEFIDWGVLEEKEHQFSRETLIDCIRRAKDCEDFELHRDLTDEGESAL